MENHHTKRNITGTMLPLEVSNCDFYGTTAYVLYCAYLNWWSIENGGNEDKSTMCHPFMYHFPNQSQTMNNTLEVDEIQESFGWMIDSMCSLVPSGLTMSE